MADLLGEDFGLAQIDKLCRCLDKLLTHKQGLPLLSQSAVGGAFPGPIRRAASSVPRLSQAQARLSAINGPIVCRW